MKINIPVPHQQPCTQGPHQINFGTDSLPYPNDIGIHYHFPSSLLVSLCYFKNIHFSLFEYEYKSR